MPVCSGLIPSQKKLLTTNSAERNWSLSPFLPVLMVTKVNLSCYSQCTRIFSIRCFVLMYAIFNFISGKLKQRGPAGGNENASTFAIMSKNNRSELAFCRIVHFFAVFVKTTTWNEKDNYFFFRKGQRKTVTFFLSFVLRYRIFLCRLL